MHVHVVKVMTLIFFLVTDPYTLFTLQTDFIEGQSYVEVRVRSVADPSRYLVRTAQGRIRLEAPSVTNRNHVFRSDTFFAFRELLIYQGIAFYQVNSSSQKCYIAFDINGEQLDGEQLDDLCSTPNRQHVFVIDTLP